MGHIGNMGHPDVKQTVDTSTPKIAQTGRGTDTPVKAGNVERYTRLTARVAVMGAAAVETALGPASLTARLRRPP